MEIPGITLILVRRNLKVRQLNNILKMVRLKYGFQEDNVPVISIFEMWNPRASGHNLLIDDSKICLVTEALNSLQ